MKPGPLGQLHLDLRDRIRLAPAERRFALAQAWARRAIHIHLTTALGRRAGVSEPRLAGWLGPIDSPEDVARALRVVDELLTSLGPYEPRLRPPYAASPGERERLGARLAWGTAKTIPENLVEDMHEDHLAKLAWSALMLAECAGCYVEEERQMLADAGGPADA